MEPPRKKVEFERIDETQVVIVRGSIVYTLPLWHLAGECFVEYRTALIPLFKDGFTILDDLRWEHFINPPVHLRANTLGRIVLCQS